MTQIELEKIADTFDTNRDGMINLNEIMAVVKGTKRTRGMPERSMSDAEKIDHEVCLQNLLSIHLVAVISSLIPKSHITNSLIPKPHATSSLIPKPHVTSSLIPKPHATSSLIPKPHVTSSLIPKPWLTYLNPRLCTLVTFLVSSPDPTQEEKVW